MEAKNPLASLGGGKDEAIKGKAADKSNNINTKPTNYADMYSYDENQLTLIKKNMDEFPIYEKDPKTGELVFRRQGSTELLKSPSS